MSGRACPRRGSRYEIMVKVREENMGDRVGKEVVELRANCVDKRNEIAFEALPGNVTGGSWLPWR